MTGLSLNNKAQFIIIPMLVESANEALHLFLLYSFTPDLQKHHHKPLPIQHHVNVQYLHCIHCKEHSACSSWETKHKQDLNYRLLLDFSYWLTDFTDRLLLDFSYWQTDHTDTSLTDWSHWQTSLTDRLISLTEFSDKLLLLTDWSHWQDRFQRHNFLHDRLISESRFI